MVTSEYALGTLGAVAVAGTGMIAMLWWVSGNWWEADLWRNFLLFLGL